MFCRKLVASSLRSTLVASSSCSRSMFASQIQRVASRSIVTVQEAKQMSGTYNTMSNDVILTMAVLGDQEAREERMIREIMSVDNLR